MKTVLTSKHGYRTELAHRKKTVQPPCVECRNQARCATEQLACADYLDYLDSGRQKCRNRTPNRRYFLRAEGGETSEAMEETKQ